MVVLVLLPLPWLEKLISVLGVIAEALGVNAEAVRYRSVRKGIQFRAVVERIAVRMVLAESSRSLYSINGMLLNPLTATGTVGVVAEEIVNPVRNNCIGMVRMNRYLQHLLQLPLDSLLPMEEAIKYVSGIASTLVADGPKQVIKS